MSLKHFIGNRILPKSVANDLRIKRDRRLLDALPTARVDTAALRPASRIDLAAIFGDDAVSAEWAAFQPTLDQITGPDAKNGVNVGDRRAIYHLVRALAPETILEVGTHIGSSTIGFVHALQNQEKTGGPRGHITTVDIADVNDPADQRWLGFGSPMSPLDMCKRIGGESFVTFVHQPSVEFLEKCDRKFDFIFLDGSHASDVVYLELPRALELLNPGGVVLLHDFFPGLKPLWSNGVVIVGPALATDRLVGEGAAMEVIPLGDLPWPTKLGSSATSLALVAGRG